MKSFGDETVLSNMSDWNPAEMIGKPSQLASSCIRVK